MFAHTLLKGVAIGLMLGAVNLSVARADEAPLPPLRLQESTSLTPPVPAEAVAPATPEATSSIETALVDALSLIGIRYHRGGMSPETGFDCSGFVAHVFREGLGLYLPRTAKAMSKAGEPVARNELKPGDLVFFNTMRRAFSHVGIYLGDNHFVHAPRTGGKVRVEDLRERYWSRRFNGARRVAVE